MAKTNQNTAKKQVKNSKKTAKKLVKNKKEIRKKVLIVAYTKKVTWEQKKQVVPLLVKRIKKAHRQKQRITNEHLRNSLAKHYGIKIGAATVRNLLHYIRVNGLIKLLCAGPNGYWIAKTTIEVTNYLKSLQSRIREIGVLKRSIDSQSHEILGKQYSTKKLTKVKPKTRKK